MKPSTTLKNIILSTAFFLSSIFGADSFAATATKTVNVSARVGASLALSADLFRNSVSDTNDIPDTEINFGFLDGSNGQLNSSVQSTNGIGSAVVLLSAVSQGIPYSIVQTGTALTAGGVTIPEGACVVKTMYSPSDNEGASLVGTLGAGNGTSWVGTKTLYTSDALGAIRVIQAHYMVTGDSSNGATEVVPVDQKAGAYSATIIFTLTS